MPHPTDLSPDTADVLPLGSQQTGNGSPLTSGSRSLQHHRGLSRAIVVQAAIDYIDAQGLDQLSMRRLGASLGVAGMTLYRYVDSREKLLDAAVDRVMDQLYATPDMLLRPDDSWQDFLRRVGGRVRRVAHEHPHLFPLLVARPTAAPLVRPPLASPEWLEGLLAGLLDRGFEPESAMYAYRAFTTVLIGHSLLEASAAQHHADNDDTGDASPRSGEPDPRFYPTLSRLLPQLTWRDLDAEFGDALEDLLHRLADHPRH